MSNNPFGLRNDSPLTNNPFSANSAANRFPAINDAGSPVPQQQPQQLGYGGGGGSGYQQPQQTGFYNQQSPQQSQQPVFPPYGQLSSSASFVNAQPTGFQPQSAFGQQYQQHQQFQQQQQQRLQQQPTGAYNLYGGGAGANDGSGAVQQTSNFGYASVADLDPYASLAHLPWAQPTRPAESSSSSMPQSPSSTSAIGGTSWNDDHPRSYVRNHKSELEGWRPDAWREFGRSIDKLKDAWIGRKELVIKAMEGYGTQWDPNDAQRVRDLLQEADMNIDTITASSFQLKEAEQGYRHSSDASSRARVREALNAGLKALPEWPEPLQTNRGVTVGYGASGQQIPNPPPQILQQPPPQQQQQFQQQPQFQPQQQQQSFQQQPQGFGGQLQQQQQQYTGWGGGAPGGYQQQPQQSSYTGYPRQW